ncbi:MAG TPA: MaoC family dehydratase N-terminal domain-containing protein [Methylomirabilota bacterium]|jgi:acyl dehydratase|nr:MaoC family dehydratase N-terminal domain-containing protein [Methylomirabilota bacterium]
MTSPRIPASVVGITAGPREHEIDARWVMAYAAALGEEAPEYFDTARSGGVLAHPLFPVCYEWPLALDVRATALPDEIAVRGVHATHRLIVHRPIRAGDRLRTTATVAALEPRSPGAYMVLRLETVDATGRPVTTTDYGSLYLGVACDSSPLSPQGRGQGEEWSKVENRDPRPPGHSWSTEVPISPTLAHVYTECARIWNPIHTDRTVARAAGLPDIILHGTATLALAISQTLRHDPRGPAAPVRALRCRFGAMVPLPSRIVVRGRRPEPSAEGSMIRFEALIEDGRPAVRDGAIVLADGPSPTERSP